MLRFILRLFASTKPGAQSGKSVDMLIGRNYKRFKPGAQVICLEAPWHSGTMPCEACMVNFGPSKHSVVTIDKYLDDRYVKLREFPQIVVDGITKDPGYLDTFFVDAEEISISEIKQILNYGNE